MLAFPDLIRSYAFLSDGDKNPEYSNFLIMANPEKNGELF
ncbi:hypothetical protein MC7420_1374 [Coleofasciculus chthonoplastes PCC 7420]|uniref:Uncharacterized protein n=1 Tax=Coleofasciculus chthonoplastes PCC 7420 TaxID=118168 RepID=B4VRE5_9CYAN|nr:hypothetical protein MC7420_1374 [Coleofasciculus chthonoplastes PCC 7420]